MNLKKEKEEFLDDTIQLSSTPIESLLENYENNHEYQENIDGVNAYLYHVHCSQNLASINEKFKAFYGLEARVHGDNEQQIFFCLHRNIHPKIAKAISDAQFGTLIDEFESCFNTKVITNLRDKFTIEEWFGTLVSTLMKCFKLIFIFVDMYKDTFLAATILITTGGWKAVLDFPTNFSSVVVICMFSTIIIPLLLSSLHLAVHNPFMLVDCLDERNPTIWKRIFAVLLCFLCTLLNPVLLITKLEKVQERARRLAKYNECDLQVISLLKKSHRIRTQLAQLFKIELGF